jgi:Raf kinase inhibitor-like YbhB/YbcL family protein
MKRFALMAALAATVFTTAAQAADFKLSVAGMKEGDTLKDAQVFSGFGCKGGNLSPALTWTDPPADTKSLAITAYDPDAPTGSGWWHWTLINLPATVRSLPEGAGDATGSKLPAGAVQGRTDFGTSAFGGACPPQGDKPHHYIFTIYALKADKVPLDASASGALIGFYINKGIGYVAKASVTLTYGR